MISDQRRPMSWCAGFLVGHSSRTVNGAQLMINALRCHQEVSVLDERWFEAKSDGRRRGRVVVRRKPRVCVREVSVL